MGLCVYHEVDGPISSGLRVLQYALSVVYGVLVLSVFAMVPSVTRFTEITSYIHHHSILYFSSYHSSSREIESKMMDDVRSLYTDLVATHLRRHGLTALFGVDICELVLSYLPPIHVVADSNLSTMRMLMMDNDDDMSTQLNDFEENWTLHMDEEEEVEIMEPDVDHHHDHDRGVKTEDEILSENEENERKQTEDDHHDHRLRLQICVTPAKMHRLRAHSDVDGNGSATENENEVEVVATPSVNPLVVSCSNLSDGSNEDGHQTDQSNLSLTPR